MALITVPVAATFLRPPGLARTASGLLSNKLGTSSKRIAIGCTERRSKGAARGTVRLFGDAKPGTPAGEVQWDSYLAADQLEPAEPIPSESKRRRTMKDQVFSDGDRVYHSTRTADITGRPLVGQVHGDRVVWDGNRGSDEVAGDAGDLIHI